VLAATDFSEPGDRAVSLAYALLASGGTVHLVHVVEASEGPGPHEDRRSAAAEGERPTQGPDVTRRLHALVPPEAAGRGIETRIHLLEAREAGAAIAAAAERCGADVICVGTHGHSGLAAAWAGSVAQGLIARSGRPVLVVGPER
jgi:nucleotide-binding universal stress UspA family protein